MKLRMLTLAVTAIALSAQGVAQQSNDGLERALADLNSGLVATQGAGVNISGDARVRNEWNEENDAGDGFDTLFSGTVGEESSKISLNVSPDGSAYAIALDGTVGDNASVQIFYDE